MAKKTPILAPKWIRELLASWANPNGDRAVESGCSKVREFLFGRGSSARPWGQYRQLAKALLLDRSVELRGAVDHP